MAKFRFTMFFEYRKYGWSETHYWAKAATEHSAILFAGQLLAEKRLQMCAPGVKLTYLRVSDDDIRRDSLAAPADLSPQIAGAGKQLAVVDVDDPANLPDFPYSVVLLRGESGPLYRKNIYISGLRDEWQNVLGVANMPAGWLKGYGAYKVELLDNWGFKVSSRNAVNNPLRPITHVAGPAPFTVSVANHGYADGDKVTVVGVKQAVAAGGARPARINGTWRIAVVDNNAFKLIGTDGTPAYLSGGLAQRRVDEVVGYTAIKVRGFTHRKRGRPFDSPRGRSRRT